MIRNALRQYAAVKAINPRRRSTREVRTARDPKIAFAVLVEYGGSGGKDAGPVAQAILEACIEHGYLSTSAKPRAAE